MINNVISCSCAVCIDCCGTDMIVFCRGFVEWYGKVLAQHTDTAWLGTVV